MQNQQNCSAISQLNIMMLLAVKLNSVSLRRQFNLNSANKNGCYFVLKHGCTGVLEAFQLLCTVSSKNKNFGKLSALYQFKKHDVQANGVKPGGGGEHVFLCNETAKWAIDETAGNCEDSGRLLFHTSDPLSLPLTLEQVLLKND